MTQIRPTVNLVSFRYKQMTALRLRVRRRLPTLAVL